MKEAGGGGVLPPLLEKEPLEEMNTWGTVTSGARTPWGDGKRVLSDTNLREIAIPREVEAGKVHARKSRVYVHGHICSGVGSAAIQVVLPGKKQVKTKGLG